MEGESGVTGSIIDEIHSLDLQRDQIEGESGITGSIYDELHSWDIQRDQMEGESGVIRSIMMNFMLWISKEIKWKVKAWYYWKDH